MTHETESLTSSEFRPSLTGSQSTQRSALFGPNDDEGFAVSPIPNPYNRYQQQQLQQQQYPHHPYSSSNMNGQSSSQFYTNMNDQSSMDSSYDSIDRALFSPGSNSSIIPSSPYTPASPLPHHQQQQQQHHAAQYAPSPNGQKGGPQLQRNHNPSYSMHSQVEAFIEGRDEVLPRTSLVEKAASKSPSYIQPLHHPGPREPNPFLRGLDPLNPSPLLPPYRGGQQLVGQQQQQNRNSLNSHLNMFQNDIDMRYGDNEGDGGMISDSMYDDMNDPILASIHNNRSYLSDQIKMHEHRSSSAASNGNQFHPSYLSSNSNNVGASGGRGGVFNIQDDEASSWLSEQSYMRSVNASTHDPFKQLLVSSGMVGSNSGWFNPNNTRMAQWLALWEEWKYTIFIFAPGIALMWLYFRYSYAEEIN
jgi:hypothetical protein